MLILVAFLAAFLIALSGGLLLFYRETMIGRLTEVTSRPDMSPSLLKRVLNWRASHVETLMDPFQRILPRSPQDVSVVEKRLIRAGLRQENAINIFYGAKVLVPLTLSAIAFGTGIYQIGPFLVFGVSGGLAFMLPDFWLGNRMAARQLAIKLGLPDVLDLLVVCLEAGLGFDQAMARVYEEIGASQPEIADEFALVALEQRAGRSRSDAWRNLAERTGVDTLRGLASIIIQADQFGTSIARTLRVYSDTMRTKRRQSTEEEAAKTTVKLVFPLVFFIFPSIFLVTVGPSAILLIESFQKYLG